MVELGKLLRRSEKVINQEDKDQELQDIWAPGSSLGGARPKASVVDPEGALWIAKFPSPKDDWDVALWEAVALGMAKKLNLPVAEFRLQNISGANILLTRRFDRRKENRIPFISAMTILDARDMEPRSYLEIAEAVIAHGAAAEADLKGLWQRLVFNVLISNLDDHLRNHGFLYDGKLSGWRLSPIYDLEPLPESAKARFLQTAIEPGNNMASLDAAFKVAGEFGLSLGEARSLAREMGKITGSWKK
jgi:serine/threonine-protein kinase HipA